MPKPVTVNEAYPARAAQPPMGMPPQQYHSYNEVTHWRKMYADLITHYETNGHSRISSATNPQLASWLADQEHKHMHNSLTPGQVQQLALMKVTFIHSNESKLGIKCGEKKCTKFGAFEGKCHEHYYAMYRRDHPAPEPTVVHDPKEKKKKKAAKGKKTKAKVKKSPVKKVAKKATKKSAVKDTKVDESEIMVPFLPPMDCPVKDGEMADAEKSDEARKTDDENAASLKDSVAAAKSDGDKVDAADDDEKKKSDEAIKTAAAEDKPSKENEAVGAAAKSIGESKEAASSKSANDDEEVTSPSKKAETTPAADKNDDASLGPIHSPDISVAGNGDRAEKSEFKTDSAGRPIVDKEVEASVKKDQDPPVPANQKKPKANASSPKKKPSKKAAAAKGKDKTAKQILIPANFKGSKPVNPVIAAAVNTMLASYPPAKSRPPIAEGMMPPQPVYQYPYPYSWPAAAPAQAPQPKAPTLQDQHSRNIWLKHYGSLILFYERFGHSDVTVQQSKELAPPSLVTWVSQQRDRMNKGLLTEDEVKRLDLLSFRQASTGTEVMEKQRCIKEDCNKFAVFNGKCHAHYTQTGKLRKRQAAPDAAAYNYFNEPTSKKSKTMKLTQAQARSIDSKIAFPPGRSGAAMVRIPGVYAGVLQTFQEKKAAVVKKKLVKAIKPKFPLVNSSRQKNGLWTLTISDDKAKDEPEKSKEPETEKPEEPAEEPVEEKEKEQEGETTALKKARGRPKGSRLKVMKLKDQTTDQVIEKIGQYVTLLANAHYCINERHYYTECTCMHYLRNNSFAVKAVSTAIFDYYGKSHTDKRHYTLERMRMGEQPKSNGQTDQKGNQRFFTLPLVYEYIDNIELTVNGGKSREDQIGTLFKHKICSSSWHNLHDNGRKVQETMQKYLDGDTSVARHRSFGIKCIRNSSAREGVLEMLQALYDEHKAANSTNEMINGKKVVVLPAAMSKKQLFRKFIADQGWKVEMLDSKTGKMAKVKDWPLLPGFYATEQEATLHNGKVAGQKINHTSFASLWKEEFPHLKVVEGMMKGDAFLHQREHVQTLLRSLWAEYRVYEDDPDEIVVLPFSKKNLFHTWIREQGWLVKDEGGRMASYKDWELLPGFYETEEEAVENGGKVAGDKISYPSFFNIWKNEFPRLRVTETRMSSSKKRKLRDDYYSEDED